MSIVLFAIIGTQIDDELREKVVRWVEWANKADPSEYELF